jgi:hypothetical protein
VPWGPSALACATIACRSGLTPHPFDRWLEQTAALDREAMAQDATAVASLIIAELEPAIAMAKKIKQAFAFSNSTSARPILAHALHGFRITGLIGLGEQVDGDLGLRSGGRERDLPQSRLARRRRGG